MRLARFSLLSSLLSLIGAPACSSGNIEEPAPVEGPSASTSASAAAAGEEIDAALAACEQRWNDVASAPGRAFPEGPVEKERQLFLGRARGAIGVFVREPRATENLDAKTTASKTKLEKELTGQRVARLVGRHEYDRAGLRAIVLREGYVYATDPEDAFELDSRLKLTDLFDDPKLVLERGEDTFELELRKGRFVTEYVIKNGPRAGKVANLLFGDRVRALGQPAEPALHRDLIALAQREGIDRIAIERVSDEAMLARVTIGRTTTKAVLTSAGAKMSLGCLALDRAGKQAVEEDLAAGKWRRSAEARMREMVTAQVDDALPFDRPREEKGPDKDGMLRPHWYSAYLRGSGSFTVEEKTYTVFAADGRPNPPQVCVDFVLDTYERGAGSWFAPLNEKPTRHPGRLDISSHGPANLRGVLGFKKFADEHSELFEVRDFKDQERIPLERRRDFFQFLLDHAGEFRAGDVLAIQGIKRDDRIHQHAILLEYTDPLTGFPAGLADQMKLPRRRTWEGIMGEAPKRSLLYRARPTEVIFRPLDEASPVAPAPKPVLASGR